MFVSSVHVHVLYWINWLIDFTGWGWRIWRHQIRLQNQLLLQVQSLLCQWRIVQRVPSGANRYMCEFWGKLFLSFCHFQSIHGFGIIPVVLLVLLITIGWLSLVSVNKTVWWWSLFCVTNVYVGLGYLNYKVAEKLEKHKLRNAIFSHFVLEGEFPVPLVTEHLLLSPWQFHWFFDVEELLSAWAVF